MKSKFLLCDRETLYLLPPSIQDWLPKKHQARFIVDILDKLDLSELEKQYSAIGRDAYPVQIMLGLLFYGYANGVYSSRKIELATYESVPFRFIAANHHPDHTSLSNFRKRFSKELDAVFLEILLIASEIGLLKMGSISTDGTKIKANASKHKALSWEYANKLEEKLRNEIAQLKKLAEEEDAKALKEVDIPSELERREERLEVIDKAKHEIQRRAAERYAREKAEYDQKMALRKQQEESGKRNNRKPPKPPTEGPSKTDQVNLTDDESRIMPVSGGGFQQSYNAQIAVDTESMLIVSNHISQCTSDQKELEPTLTAIQEVACATRKKVDSLLGDAGYYSEKNVKLCEKEHIVPYIAIKRDQHNTSLSQRLEHAEESPETGDSVADMKHRLKTKAGKELYAKRKSTVEPVFGIIKNVMKFRSFLLRGLEKVRREFNLVAIAYNLKRLYALQA